MHRSARRRRVRSALVGPLFLAALAGSTQGAIRTWNGTIGDWTDDFRWSGAVEPTALDNARILAGEVTVSQAGEVALDVFLDNALLTINGGNLAAANGIQIQAATLSIQNSGFFSSGVARIGQNATGTVLLSGGATQWNITNDASVGYTGNGKGLVTVNNGAIWDITRDLRISEHAGNSGSKVTVDGVGSEVRVGRFLSINGRENGSMDITGGADVFVTDRIIFGDDHPGSPSVSVMTVSGNIAGNASRLIGSSEINVGDQNVGHLIVENGAVAQGTRYGAGGDAAASGSSTVVRGVGTQFITTGTTIGTHDSNIGDSAPTSFTVESGGSAVFGGRVIVGRFAGSAGSQLIVTGAGSTLSAGPSLQIGDEAAGHLQVLSGGVVTSSETIIGANTLNSGLSTVLVRGTNSRLNPTGAMIVGDQARGSLTVDQAGGMTIGGDLWLGHSSANASGSTMVVDGAGTQVFVTGASAIGELGRADLTVSGGALLQCNNSSIAIDGDSADSTLRVTGANSTFRVTDTNGWFRVGRDRRGVLLVENGGTFEALGIFSLDVGRYAGAANSVVTVTGSGSQLRAAGTPTQVGYEAPASLSVADFANAQFGALYAGYDTVGTVTLSGGADATASEVLVAWDESLNGGSDGSQLTVSGTGTTLSVSSTLKVGPRRRGHLDMHSQGVVTTGGIVLIAENASSANSTVSVNGTGTLLSVGDSMTVGAAALASLSVTGGGVAQVSNDVTVAAASGAGGSQFHVGGAGSRLTIGTTSGDDLFLASSDGPYAGLGLIDGGGLVEVAGQTRLRGQSVLTIGAPNSPGTLRTRTLSRDSGGPDISTLSFVAGTLELTGSSLSINSSSTALLNNGSGQGQMANSTAFVLSGGTSQRNLTVAGDTDLDGTKQLRVEGGTFKTGSVDLSGSDPEDTPLVFVNGRIELTNSNLLIGSQGILREDWTTLSTSKTMAVSGTVFVDSLSRLEVTDNAALSAGKVQVLGGGTFVAGGTAGVLDARLSSSDGSRIELAGNLSIGRATAVDGVYINGECVVDRYEFTLLDANAAAFDSGALLSLGSSLPAIVSAANGAVFDFGANAVGWGFISTPNSILKPLINNGAITGNTLAQPISLTGYVKGVGTFNNVNFLGTFSPGLSPTLSVLGSAAFSPDSVLLMELGGLSPGDEHDQILTTGTLMLGGTLDVRLIDGFVPREGDHFVLFDSAARGSILGGFDSFAFPALAGGLSWSYEQGTLTVVPAPAAALAFLVVGGAGALARRRGRAQ